MKLKKYKWIIGIDPGINTGYAIWEVEDKRFWIIQSIMIHEAIKSFLTYKETGLLNQIFVRVEDARKRKWFGKSGREQLQGAGSIKRDAKIWEDFLTDLGIDFEMVAPKNNKTKLDAKKFALITKFEGKTNEHGRDAGMLCFGY